jgi:hypothetical protein
LPLVDHDLAASFAGFYQIEVVAVPAELAPDDGEIERPGYDTGCSSVRPRHDARSREWNHADEGAVEDPGGETTGACSVSIQGTQDSPTHRAEQVRRTFDPSS